MTPTRAFLTGAALTPFAYYLLWRVMFYGFPRGDFMADRFVFGDHHGGTFVSEHPVYPPMSYDHWCDCGRHRVRAAGGVCPVCEDAA